MIQHGIPQHPFFYIIQPPSAVPYGERVQPQNPDFKKPVMELQDPKSKEKYKCELWDVLRLELFRMPDHMCRAAYGANAIEVKNVLVAKYPSIKNKQEVEFLQLKKL